MFGKDFQRKYALTDQGVRNTKQATAWTVTVNLVVMGGMGILYMMMSKYMETLTLGTPLPGAGLFLILVLAFVLLSLYINMPHHGTPLKKTTATTTKQHFHLKTPSIRRRPPEKHQ